MAYVITIFGKQVDYQVFLVTNPLVECLLEIYELYDRIAAFYK